MKPESEKIDMAAIAKMLDVLAFFRGEFARECASHVDPVLGRSTLSIGTIRGGSKTNIIPESCEASIDWRIVPSQYHPTIIEDLTAGLRKICPDIEVDAIPAPPLYTDPTHPMLQKLATCGAKPIGAPWFCDACYFAAQGMPSIALGPGSIDQAHTADEWLAIADLERGVDFFRAFLGTLASG